MITLLLCAVCAVLVWGLVLCWARREIRTIQIRAQNAVWHWKRQAELARRQVARLTREATLRDQAWQRGRDDVIAIVPLIDAARTRDEAPARREEGAA